MYTVALPTYMIDTEPDHKTIGKVVDNELCRHFTGQTVVVRSLSSSAHPSMTIDALIEKIRMLGTDRYDPDRAGDRYDNLGGKQIDFFGFRRKVGPRMQLFKDITWGFYHSAIAIHGRPERIDLLLVYDAAQLKAVLHQYEGRTDKKRDGFVFKDPANKSAALKAIIKIA